MKNTVGVYCLKYYTPLSTIGQEDVTPEHFKTHVAIQLSQQRREPKQNNRKREQAVMQQTAESLNVKGTRGRLLLSSVVVLLFVWFFVSLPTHSKVMHKTSTCSVQSIGTWLQAVF